MARQPSPRPATPAGEVLSPLQRHLALLPPPVAAIRAKILEAVASGDIEAVRVPIEHNETPPLFARGAGRSSFGEAIETLKRRSFDGEGRETLSILRAALDQPYVKVTRGPFASFVWPGCALVPYSDPTPEDILAMWRCVRFANLGAATPDGRPIIERLGFGADGVWHYFWSG